MVFRDYPKDKILIETDSPYLAPVPYRGKVNEPAYVVKTAEKLAELLGLAVDEAAKLTTDNFYRLYKKAKG
jgi:TatD DNase family protein